MMWSSIMYSSGFEMTEESSGGFDVGGGGGGAGGAIKIPAPQSVCLHCIIVYRASIKKTCKYSIAITYYFHMQVFIIHAKIKFITHSSMFASAD